MAIFDGLLQTRQNLKETCQSNFQRELYEWEMTYIPDEIQGNMEITIVEHILLLLTPV